MTQPGVDPYTAPPPGQGFGTGGTTTPPPTDLLLGPGHWSAPAAPSRPPLDAWPVVSLVTSTVGLTLVGLVAGVVGLVRTTGGRRRGRLLAVAGIVVAVLQALLQALLLAAVWPSVVAGFEAGAEAGADVVVAEEEAGTEQAGADGEGAGLVPSDALGVGDCFQDPDTETFYEVLTVPCSQPHDAEVVAVLELDGTTWPGDDEVGDQAWDACMVATADVFEAAGVDGTDYEFGTFTPTRESWLLDGDRQTTCLAYGLDGPLDTPILP